jgi:hypothetical protein
MLLSFRDVQHSGGLLLDCDSPHTVMQHPHRHIVRICLQAHPPPPPSNNAFIAACSSAASREAPSLSCTALHSCGSCTSSDSTPATALRVASGTGPCHLSAVLFLHSSGCVGCGSSGASPAGQDMVRWRKPCMCTGATVFTVQLCRQTPQNADLALRATVHVKGMMLICTRMTRCTIFVTRRPETTALSPSICAAAGTCCKAATAPLQLASILLGT